MVIVSWCYNIVVAAIIAIFFTGCNQAAHNVVASDDNAIYPTSTQQINYLSTPEHYRDRIATFKKAPLTRKDIVFIGDSITEGGGNWSNRLGQPSVVNRGIGGDVTDGVLARLGEIRHFKPRAVFLMIGFNDVNNIHFSREEVRITSPKYTAKNILRIIEIISSGSPETQIIVQSILPCRNSTINELIRTVNAIVADASAHANFRFVDLYSHFTDHTGRLKTTLLDANAFGDGHLNEKGYQHWGRLITPLIDTVNQ